MRANSTQPIEGARVAIWGDMGPDFETRTDANGHYLFPALRYGTYNMEVQAEGYLSSPDPSTNVRIRLTHRQPGTRSTRRVADRRGRDHAVESLTISVSRSPAIGVEILQLLSDSFGRPSGASVASSQNRYQWRVSRRRSIARGLLRASLRKESKSSADMAATYFPGTSDPRSAAVVSLREGGEQVPLFRSPVKKLTALRGESLSRIQNRQCPPCCCTRFRRIRKSRSRGLHLVFPIEASAEGVWDFQLRGVAARRLRHFRRCHPGPHFHDDPQSWRWRSATAFQFGAEFPGRVATDDGRDP